MLHAWALVVQVVAVLEQPGGAADPSGRGALPAGTCAPLAENLPSEMTETPTFAEYRETRPTFTYGASPALSSAFAPKTYVPRTSAISGMKAFPSFVAACPLTS